MNPDEKVAWMRAVGAIQAQWSIDGELTMCVLGPVPGGTVDDTKTINHPEPDEESMLFASSS